MPEKFRRYSSKAIIRSKKKKRRMMERTVSISPAISAPGTNTTVVAPTPVVIASKKSIDPSPVLKLSDLAIKYAYVNRELLIIGSFSLVIFAILVILSFFLK